MQVSHRFTSDSAVFDDGNLVSCAGLVPVMTLAEQTGLPALLDEKVRITRPLIKSGSTNPAPKLTTLIAGMCAGADCSEDADIVRSGGMKTLFGGVYAPSTIGTLLREFTFGHARQLESVLREHLAALGERVDLLAGADVRAFIDVDSLLRPVYGHAKQGALQGGSPHARERAGVFAAVSKVRRGQRECNRACSPPSAGVATVFTGTCDNVVTLSNWLICATARRSTQNCGASLLGADRSASRAVSRRPERPTNCLTSSWPTARGRLSPTR